jgi:two-component system sensor histidine kinase BarA
MQNWPLSWRLFAVGTLPVGLLGGVLLGLYLGEETSVAAVAVATVSALGLGGGLGLWVAGGLRRAVQGLIASCSAWARGDRPARAAGASGGELGELERAIDRMAEALHAGIGRAERSERIAAERLRQRIEELDRKDQALELEKSRLEAAGLARSRWLADMSHELRTPLNAISGFSDLLAGYEVDAAHRGYVENIRRAASELLLMIGEILDYAKIEAGEIEVRRRPFDFYEEMEGVVTLMGRLAHARGLDFLTFLDPRIPDRVTSDPQRLRQAVINLLSNAVKFTERGHVALEVRLCEASGPALEFRVIDTGVGIEPDAAGRLFQPFAQGIGGLHAQAAGTGLGLSITKYFVERLGGEIGCRGAPGEGSTFWFRVPLEIAEGDAPYHRREPLGALRVLVFDRNPVRAGYTRELLRGWGLDVDHAEDLEAFRSRYLDGGHDAILYFLNRSDVDTDLQVSIGDLARVEAPKYFFHAAEHHGSIEPRSGFHHLSALISPRRLHRLLAEAEAPRAVGDTSTTQAGPALAAEGLHGLRVLIADDNEINRHLLGVYVSRNDGEALFAADGLAALDEAEAQRPDAALLDLNMPRMSGIETARELRRRLPGTRLVAVTAETRASRLAGLREEGFDAVLIKPVTERRLLETLTALCPPQGREAGRAGEAEGPLVDTEKAVRLTGGKRELAEELFGMLLADLRAKREQLVFRNEQDRERLRGLAHRIQGGARYCAAGRVQRAAQRLEYVTESGRSESEIEAALNRLRDSIDELLRAENPYQAA